MYDLLNRALANGAYGTIPGHLMLAARQNPQLDWNAPLKDVLTRRDIQVGNRQYAACLTGIPVHGDLGRSFDPVATIPNILKDMRTSRLLAKEEGIIFLDTPLPRSTIQMLSVEDMYNLIPRLFSRARDNHEPVLDARITECESGHIDAGVMVALVYWKADQPSPLLLSNAAAQLELARIVAKNLAFDRATPFMPRPGIRASRLEPFFDATKTTSREIAERYMDLLMYRLRGESTQATIEVITSGEPWGPYTVNIEFLDGGDPSEYCLALHFDELRDGNVSDMLDFIVGELEKRGILKYGISYKTPAFAGEAEEVTANKASVH